MKDLDAATQLVHAGRDWDPEWGCVNPPVVRASTVLHTSCEDMMDRVHDEMACRDGKPCYGSYGGPAHKAFYSAMKTLEGPERRGRMGLFDGPGRHDDAALCVRAGGLSCALFGLDLRTHARIRRADPAHDGR